MSEFATELRLNPWVTIGDFWGLVSEWILGMKRTSFRPEDLELNFGQISEHVIEKESERISIYVVDIDGGEAVGVSYSFLDENNIVWISELVATKESEKFLLSIRVFRQSTGVKFHLPSPQRPFIIKMLFSGDWKPCDGTIPLKTTPIPVEKGQEGLFVELVGGSYANRLPIVYASRVRRNNCYAVDIKSLAFDLGGMAHVLYDQENSVAAEIATRIGDRSPLDGQIAIYWPDEAGLTIYQADAPDMSRNQLKKKIVRDIFEVVSSRRITPCLSLQFVQEIHSKTTIESLKRAGSKDLSEYIDNFDIEIAAKDKRIQDAEEEISRLKSRLRSKAAAAPPEGAAVSFNLRYEKDFYPGELREFALRAFEQSLANSEKESRRNHIMKDLVDSNASSGVHAHLRENLKSALKGYGGLDPRVRKELREIGFDIEEDSKHIKITFFGDQRYLFVMPKTPSDHRSGANMISDIGKKLTG